MLLPFETLVPCVASSVFIATGAVVVGDVAIGDGSSVWYNCVLRGDVASIAVGARTNLQDLTMVHVTSGRFATQIGDDVTVGHRAILHGCRVGNGCLIGMGAIVLDGADIGSESMIAAGAVVAPGTVVPPRTLWMGTPARERRPLTDEEVANLYRSAAHYVETARRHRASALPPSQ